MMWNTVIGICILATIQLSIVNCRLLFLRTYVLAFMPNVSYQYCSVSILGRRENRGADILNQSSYFVLIVATYILHFPKPLNFRVNEIANKRVAQVTLSFSAALIVRILHGFCINWVWDIFTVFYRKLSVNFVLSGNMLLFTTPR